MSPLKFYYDDLSQPCRALEIFLLLNKIPFEPKIVALSKGQQFTESFGKLNPLNKVPVIDDNGFILTESIAIFIYLMRTKKAAEHWYPRKVELRAKVDEYMSWQHIGLRAPCALYVFAKFFTPLMTGNAPHEKRIENLKNKMEEACDQLDNVWLKNKKYICGDEITIADLLAVEELQQLRLAKYDPRIGREKLDEWMERVRVRTNPHFDRVHSRIIKISSQNYDTISKL